MDLSGLLDALARSGLDDGDYADVVAAVRSLVARADAGGALAEAVLRAEHYQPSDVLAYVGRYYMADQLTDAA